MGGSRILSSWNARFSCCTNLHRLYGSLLSVAVLSDYNTRFLYLYLSRLPYHVHNHIDTVTRLFAP